MRFLYSAGLILLMCLPVMGQAIPGQVYPERLKKITKLLPEWEEPKLEDWQGASQNKLIDFFDSDMNNAQILKFANMHIFNIFMQTPDWGTMQQSFSPLPEDFPLRMKIEEQLRIFGGAEFESDDHNYFGVRGFLIHYTGDEKTPLEPIGFIGKNNSSTLPGMLIWRYLPDGHGLLDAVWVEVDKANWYALEYRFYPNGHPHYLCLYKDGKLERTCWIWTPEGKKVYEGPPRTNLPLPIFSDAIDLDAPPTVETNLEVKEAEDNGIRYCTVYLSLMPPGELHPVDKTRIPFRTIAVPNGGQLVLEAPELEQLEFVGWSGDVPAGGGTKLTLAMQKDIDIVLHAQIKNNAQAALLSELKNTHPELDFNALMKIEVLDLSSAGVDDLFDLKQLVYLKNLDASANGIKNLQLDDYRHVTYQRMIKFTQAPQVRLKDYAQEVLASKLNFWSLESLNVSRNLIEFADMDIPNLRVANLSYNPLSAMVYNFPYIEDMDLSHTKIDMSTGTKISAVNKLNLDATPLSDISKFAKLLPDPCTLEISLREVKLQGSQVQGALEEMRRKGARLIYDAVDEGFKISEGDSDGDGYSNQDEWRFVCLFYGKESDAIAAYEKISSDAGKPSEYLAALPDELKVKDADTKSVAAIPTEKLYVDVNGSAFVFPGNGEQKFAKYRFTEPGHWDFNKVTFEVRPEKGWKLLEVQNAFTQKVEMVTEFELSFEKEQRIYLKLVQQGELPAISFADALTLFNKKHNIVDDINNLDFGEKKYTNNQESYAGDGLPDLAMFHMLDTSLKEPKHLFDAYINSPETFVETLNYNIEQAKALLGDSSGDAFDSQVIGAYFTIGNWNIREWITDFFKIKFDKELSGLKNATDQFVGDETFCNDISENAEVWARVSRGYDPSPELYEAFCRAALKCD